LIRGVAPNVSGVSSPFDCFTNELFNTIVTETYRYYQQHCKEQEKKTLQPDVTLFEIRRFIALIILMGHDDRDTMKDYCSTKELCHTLFYSEVMKRGRFLHILRFINFEINEIPSDDL
jgi:hypothetical protein